MNRSSFSKDQSGQLKPIESKPIIQTAFTREIQISILQGHEMKEHKTAFPIVVHLLSGRVDFSVDSNTLELHEGAILTLAPNVPHSIFASENSTIRLTLVLSDDPQRVQEAAEK